MDAKFKMSESIADKKQEIEFEQLLEAFDKGGCGVKVPFSVQETFGKKGQVRVKGTINGKSFSSTLAPYGGVHYLGLRKELREGLDIAIGDLLCITIAEDIEERVINVPADFAKALSEKPTADALFHKLSYTHRKEYVAWIESAKKAETRNNRISKSIVMLSDNIKHP